MATVVYASDLSCFQSKPLNPTAGTISSPVPTLYHPSVGHIQANHFEMPFFQVTDLCWETTRDVELHHTDSPEFINLSFFLEGHLDSTFSSLGKELNMRANQHNLVFSPDGKDINRIARNQSMKMLAIGVDKHFFLSSIEHTDAWSEQIHTELFYNRPFSGSLHNFESTSPMVRLIDGIRNCTVTGPLRNLMLQSRILELMALQLEQFRMPSYSHPDIRPDEADKLFQLKVYLETNFLTDLSLAQLSKVCLLNEFKVKKGFKSLFGTTVFNYVRKLRMDYASNLLLHTNASVDEIADALGYEHSQHFSIAFKKYTGVTPSQFQGKSR